MEENMRQQAPMLALAPSEWQDYADEHVLLVRAWDSGCPSVFEIVRIKDNPFWSGTVKFRHEIIFIDDYLHGASKHSLDQILHGFGYKDMGAYIAENGEDVWLLASLIAESRGDTEDAAEIVMEEDAALDLAEQITGKKFGRKPAHDHCVICGRETDYTPETHISLRAGYVEGVGQICRCCLLNNPALSVEY